MSTHCDIVPEYVIGFTQKRPGAPLRQAVIWPVLEFRGNVSDDIRRAMVEPWRRYAVLRAKLDRKWNEAIAREMLSFESALFHLLIPELPRSAKRKTVAAEMNIGDAFVAPHPMRGAQYISNS